MTATLDGINKFELTTFGSVAYAALQTNAEHLFWSSGHANLLHIAFLSQPVLVYSNPVMLDPC